MGDGGEGEMEGCGGSGSCSVLMVRGGSAGSVHTTPYSVTECVRILHVGREPSETTLTWSRWTSLPRGGGTSELAASSLGGGLDPSLTCCIIPGGGSSPPTDMQHHP